jgi:hypothetical protein
LFHEIKGVSRAVNFVRFDQVEKSKMRIAKDCSRRHLADMSTVAEIKSAIEQLSIEERAELIADLCGWTDDDWDRQMKMDTIAGKFASINRQADEAHTSGKTTPLKDILNEP